MSAHFEIFKDSAGEWRYRFKGANGEIMCQSEAYTRREDAKRGVYDFGTALFAQIHLPYRYTEDADDSPPSSSD